MIAESLAGNDTGLESDVLHPSATLRKCNGQDITRRGGKGKGRIMLVMPAQFAFLKGTEGSLGKIDKINTESPEFVVPTTEGDLVFKGRFVESASLSYLGIELFPRKMQSVCTDVIARALVFDNPALVLRDQSAMSPPIPIARGSSIKSATSAQDSMLLTQETIVSSQGNDQEPKGASIAEWQLRHGCSTLARQHEKVETDSSVLRKSVHASNFDDDDIYADIDDYSDSGSEFGDSKTSAKKRKSMITKVPKQVVSKKSLSVEMSTDDDRDFPQRPTSIRSTKKVISYNVDDIESDDGIDEDDLVPEIMSHMKAASKKGIVKVDSALSKIAVGAKKTPKRIQSTAVSKVTTVKKQSGSKKVKDNFDFPSSSDEDFYEIIERNNTSNSPKKRIAGSRPVRSSAKKTKTYHFSSDEAEFE